MIALFYDKKNKQEVSSEAMEPTGIQLGDVSITYMMNGKLFNCHASDLIYLGLQS